MEFVEPPPLKHKRNSQKWIDIVDTLKQNPGEYGRLSDQAIGISTHIKNGRYPAFYPKDTGDKETYIAQHWEITTRSAGKNRVDLFIKWLG